MIAAGTNSPFLRGVFKANLLQNRYVVITPHAVIKPIALYRGPHLLSRVDVEEGYRRKKTKLSRDKRLEEKRIAERKRKEQIRNDPKKLEELRRKERERYHKKKAEGKIILLSKMPPSARKFQQQRNRINSKAYYERNKDKLRAQRASKTNKSIKRNTKSFSILTSSECSED